MGWIPHEMARLVRDGVECVMGWIFAGVGSLESGDWDDSLEIHTIYRGAVMVFTVIFAIIDLLSQTCTSIPALTLLSSSILE